jgi:hypothetical protein
MENDGEPIPNYFPAVVTEDAWRQAQAAIAGRKRASGRPGENETNLFTGIAYHAVRREKLCVRSQVPDANGRRYVYLAPRAAVAQLRCRAGEGCRYDQLEDGVLDAVRELRPEDVLPPQADHDGREKRIAELTGRAVSLDHRASVIQSQIEDPVQDAAVIPALVASLRRVAADKVASLQELERLKLESQTGRGEALAELKTLVDLLKEARGKPEEGELRRQTKAALRHVVEEVWILPQVVTTQKIILHVQIYLRSGRRKPLMILPRPRLSRHPGTTARLPVGFRPWLLEGCDFRAGDIGESAGHTLIA